METDNLKQEGSNANTMLPAGGFNKYKVIVRRNYYGEIQEKQVQIEGETLERAKFYFNTESLFWSVVSACN